MRIRRIEVKNVGGLPDCTLDLPTAVLTAIAGQNGTGKSKLLSCILAPWTLAVPMPQDPEQPVEVRLSVSLTETELDAVVRFAVQRTWPADRPSSEATIVVSRNQSATNYVAEPYSLALIESFRDANFLNTCPTMDMIYLPAERRLNAHGGGTIDLAQLADAQSASSTSQGRSQAISGILDDNEFQSYARALCVAGSLPSEDAANTGQAEAQSKWGAFKRSVDVLLHPKVLLPLTREHPDELRVGLPGGGFHPVHALSSGERQALVIMSRVFRAGEEHSLVAIDEPDAYLHPSLSSKLLDALAPGMGASGQMIVATHSPSILDTVEPGAIIRLSHDSPPSYLENEEQRLQLYREAGFKASALSQSDLLLVTEGEFDAEVLPQLIPLLGGAAIRPANGRNLVLRTLESLNSYDIPILGVVDADIKAEEPGAHISSICHVWDSADIEGVLLSDNNFLQAAIDGNFFKSKYNELSEINSLLRQLLQKHKEQSIAEMAMRALRDRASISWPSPRRPDVMTELKAVMTTNPRITETDIDDEWIKAEAVWSGEGVNKWKLVRGKWIIGEFVSAATEFRSSAAFVKAVIARKPEIEEIRRLEKLVGMVIG